MTFYKRTAMHTLSEQEYEDLKELPATRFIEMLSNQQERNAAGELQDTEINCTLQFLINAVKEEFFKE